MKLEFLKNLFIFLLTLASLKYFFICQFNVGFFIFFVYCVDYASTAYWLLYCTFSWVFLFWYDSPRIFCSRPLILWMNLWRDEGRRLKKYVLILTWFFIGFIPLYRRFFSIFFVLSFLFSFFYYSTYLSILLLTLTLRFVFVHPPVHTYNFWWWFFVSKHVDNISCSYHARMIKMLESFVHIIGVILLKYYISISLNNN